MPTVMMHHVRSAFARGGVKASQVNTNCLTGAAPNCVKSVYALNPVVCTRESAGGHIVLFTLVCLMDVRNFAISNLHALNMCAGREDAQRQVGHMDVVMYIHVASQVV